MGSSLGKRGFWRSAPALRMAGIVLLACAFFLAFIGGSPARAENLGDFILKSLGLQKKEAAPRRLMPRKPKKEAPSGNRGKMRTSAIPLPRPRPPAIARIAAKGAHPAKTEPAQALAVTGDGRVAVKVIALGRERNPFEAVKLAPKEKGRWEKQDIALARKRCTVVLATTNLDAEPLSPIGGRQGCGIAAPILVRSLGAVQVRPPAKLNCTFAAALYRWITDVVQPAARKRFGQPVIAVRQLSSYACRRRGGITRGPVRISEHAFGNAIDIGAFTLADGRTISVLKDWGTFSALFNKKAAFLKEVHKKACGIFATVLGPEANRAHKNHFHFDLGRDGRYKYCR